MNTREQYLVKRVEALEAALRLAYEEMFVAQLIIERVESVANAFAFDVANDNPEDIDWFVSEWEKAQKKARADSDKARGISRAADGSINPILPVTR